TGVSSPLAQCRPAKVATPLNQDALSPANRPESILRAAPGSRWCRPRRGPFAGRAPSPGSYRHPEGTSPFLKFVDRRLRSVLMPASLHRRDGEGTAAPENVQKSAPTV